MYIDCFTLKWFLSFEIQKRLYFYIRDVINNFSVTRCSVNKGLRKRENLTGKLLFFPTEGRCSLPN